MAKMIAGVNVASISLGSAAIYTACSFPKAIGDFYINCPLQRRV